MIPRALYSFLLFFIFTGNIFSQEVPLPKFYFSQIGEASFYGDEFQNRKTSNGEIYDKNNYTAAHPFLAFGTSLKVTNLKNNKITVVRINDRGPFKKGRIIDLSYAAAFQLGVVKHGTVKVKIETLAEPEDNILDEVVLFDDLVSKGEEYQILFKNKSDSTNINNIISSDGKLKVSLFRHRKSKAKETIADNLESKDTGRTVEDKSTGLSIYSIQVGAFISFDNAEELQQSLLSKKYKNVEVLSFREKNSSLYRVFVGQFKNKEEATNIKNKLLKDNIVGFIITKGI
jgi:rare lipoprotein A (peptidoglycan hydrolase)